MKLSDVDQSFYKKMSEAIIKPTLGGDPEFFIADKKGDIVNADRFLPSKYEPLQVEDSEGSSKSHVFFDGIQAEIAPDYNRCRELLADNIFNCLKKVSTLIPSDFKFTMRPSARIKRSVIENADPEARIFGCEPDFNAYTCGINTVEMDASKHPFRYAGGHMHFGVSSEYLSKESTEYQLAKTELGHLRIVKFMDMIVTLPTLAFDQDEDARRRRTKYGRSGCFRPTPYGIEYRSQSCWWMKSPITMSLIYGLGRLAWIIAANDMDNRLRELTGLDDETVRGIIDETDVEYAYKMWTRLRTYLAITSVNGINPLHVRTSYGALFATVDEDYNPLRSITLPYSKSNSGQVYGLAAFEYLVKNGLDVIVNPDVRKEWQLGDRRMENTHGFTYRTYKALVTNADFQKFQTSFFKEMGLA